MIDSLKKFIEKIVVIVTFQCIAFVSLFRFFTVVLNIGQFQVFAVLLIDIRGQCFFMLKVLCFIIIQILTDAYDDKKDDG